MVKREGLGTGSSGAAPAWPDMRRRFALLAALMVTTSVGAILVMAAMLYRQNMQNQREHLRTMAQSQARMIEAVARHDARVLGEDEPAAATTLSQIVDAHRQYPGWQETGEFTLARREGDAIIFVLRHRHGVEHLPAPVPVDAELAEPMRRALRGESGTVVGLDYRGEEVLAAHEWISVLNLGIVAKVDVAEIRAPFVRAGLAGGSIVLLLLVLSLGVFFKVGGPIVRRLEAHAESLQNEVLERTEVEASLQETIELLEAVHEANPDLQLVLDEEGTILRVHQSAGSVPRFDDDALVGRRWQDTVPSNAVAAYDAATCDGGRSTPGMIEYQTREGNTEHVYEARIVVLEAGGAVVTLRDITERKEAEADRERLLSALDQTAESIIITSADGAIQYVNPAFERVSGFTKAEAIGKSPGLSKSGRHSRAFYQDLWETIAAGDVWHGQIVNRRQDGELYVADTTISPVFDADGEIANFVAVERDTTHERELEAQLRQSQKMETIGTLTGGIAHDFNNILHAIIGFSRLAQESIVDDKDEAIASLNEIDRGARRAADLVGQLLAFSRAEETPRRAMYVAPVINDALNLLRRTLPSTLEMRRHIHEHGYPVVADPTQIHQIVMNLCTNAMQAMEGGRGVLEVGLRTVTLDEALVTRHGTLDAGDYVQLSVEDTGPGIREEDMEHIFEPFFTTKAPGKGTGLGLSMVHGIVTSMGGITVPKIRPLGGTSFHIYMPRSQEIPMEAQVQSPVRTKKVPCARVMFVDDESSIAGVTKKLLVRRGFEVDTFTDSTAALAAFERDPASYAIVITDLTMPGMTGEELARRVRRARPAIPVLLASGQIGELTANEHIDEVLQKPVPIADLVAAIHRSLRSAAVVKASRPPRSGRD